MRPRHNPKAIIASVAFLASPVAAVDLTPEQRLASEFMRSALTSSAISPMTSDTLNISVILARESVALDPESAGLWRVALDLATLAERDDFRTQAIETLSRLEPQNETVRLQRLNAALNRYQTVEERIGAYERLLDDDANIQQLGEAMASRLALDLALLKQRQGDTEGFAKWLGRSLELDRSNQAAAAIATGFFAANVDDALGRAELLVNLMMADPTDVPTQISLAQLLLESGAYVGARRMYTLALDGMKIARMLRASGLMADVAVTQWAAGDAEAALITIEHRQKEIDEEFRLEMAQQDENLTRVEIEKLQGPIDPTLAAVGAVIHHGRGDAQAARALQAAISAYEEGIAAGQRATPPAEPANLAARHLEIAWMVLWLSDDAAKASEHIAAAQALQPLSDQAAQRFEGWQALKRGEIEQAIERLTPLAEDDSAARVGLAIALERRGRIKDAAAQLLALNQAQPGTMIGIWAAGELTRLLGQRVPLSQQATALERLIASIPQSFDRYTREPSLAVALRIVPENLNPGPYEPVRVRLELTNNTTMPLAIDREGPLRPQVLIVPAYSTVTSLNTLAKPFVINFDRALRLMPHETVTQSIDLRWYTPGTVLNAIAPVGAIVKLTAQSNFIATEGGIVIPGLYGREVDGPLLRVDGVRKNDQWLSKAVAAISDPGTDPQVLLLPIALVSAELALSRARRDLPAEERKQLDDVAVVIPDAFARLNPVSQAWLLTILSPATASDALLAMARKSESRLVRIAYLLYHLKGDDDPMLDAARRGDDETLRQLAESLANAAAAAKEAAAAGSSGVGRPQPPR